MLSKDLEENINKIKLALKNSIDYTYKIMKLDKHNICLIMDEPLISSDKVNDYILKNLTYIIEKKIKIKWKNISAFFLNTIPGDKVKEITNIDDLYYYLHNGFTIILFDKCHKALAIETKANLDRGIVEPTVEQSISGPKDSFNENYKTNLGLIRKRIKNNNLIIEEMNIGKQTSTKINILYMDNIIEKELLDNIRNRLNNINIDSILDSGNIRELITSSNKLFPVAETTERPDLACMALLDGKICLVIENSPNVLLAPTFFVDFFHNPEDNYQKAKNISFIRIIRFIAFIISIITPAFYVAITTYNHETIPTNLLINFAAQRANVPFPAIIEAIGMTLIFEILRESDIRMPNQMGSAISILGAIVLGDAAVTAGIVSPIMVIVVALTAISGLIFSHVVIVNAVRWWRIIFMAFATILGIPGIIFGIFLLVLVLSSIDAFGKPYLYPFAPFNITMLQNSLLKKDIKKATKRNPLLTDSNYTRKTI